MSDEKIFPSQPNDQYNHGYGFPFWFHPPIQPIYNDHANYNTNAKNYYDYLANDNEGKDLIYWAVNRLLARSIKVKDTPSVDLTLTGNWIDNGKPSGEYPPTNYDDFITLESKVVLSNQTEELTIACLHPRATHFDVANALKIYNDGLYAKDLFPAVHAIDEKVQSMIDRVDKVDPEGSEIIVGGINQYESTLPPQINQGTVKNNLLTNQSLVNLTLVADIHLRTDYNGYSSKQFFDSITPIQDIAHVSDVAFYLGDNIDGLSGQATDKSGMIPAERVKYGNIQAYKKVMNALVLNEPVPTYALIGNHDHGGIPYFLEDSHKDMVISHDVLSKLAGNPAYGVHKIPNKHVAIIYLDTMDVAYEELNDTVICGVSNAQLTWLQSQLDVLENNYHILVLGHHQLGDKHMKNGQRLIDIFEEFEARETSKFISYVHGHMHMDKDWRKGTLIQCNVMSLINAFPSKEQIGKNNQVGFYALQVDTTKRTATFYPIGHATLTSVLTY